MNRRAFLKAVGATVLLAPGGLRGVAPDDVGSAWPDAPVIPGAGAKPNIILVLCDDLGWGDLGAFWQNTRSSTTHIDTPNLDSAMLRGAMLTHAYTTSPVCAPARASMVTGKHQGHCNLRDNMFDRPVDAHMTIGTVLKQAGYATWHVGKWGIGGGYESKTTPRRAMACDAGFDYSYCYPAHGHGHSFYHFESTTWDTSETGSPIVEGVSEAAYSEGRYNALSAGATSGGEFAQEPDGTYYRRLVSNDEVRYCYDTDLFTAKIKQLIRAHQDAKREEPFFCYACYTTVHGSGATHGDTALTTKTNFHVPGRAYPEQDDADTDWGGGVKWEKDAQGYLPFKELDASGANTSNTWIHPDYKEYDSASKQRYATNVRRLDDALGDLFHFLKLRGLEENTLFVFTSDNGPAGEYVSGYSTRIGWVEGAFKSNGPFSGMKRWVQEGGVREPTFAVWQGVIPASGTDTPREITTPCQFPAWMATFADVAGLPQPAHCDGVSLLPTLTGVGRQLPMRIYAEQRNGENPKPYEQMVRDGDYVLLRDDFPSGTVKLYNVIDDPAQKTNLAGEAAYADRVRWMSNLLVTCRIPAGKVPDACGALAAYCQTPVELDALPYPAVSTLVGKLPAWEVRVFRKGASAWPWVPNFRTLTPDAGFLVADAQALHERLSEQGAFGLSIRGWLEVPAQSNVTFSATGAGGCQLWIHEAHALEFEAGDCVDGRAITLLLAKGRHPFRLYLTTSSGVDGLCTVSAGETRLA